MADDSWKVKSTETTWGPSPGDQLAPPPTPQAPEIPMSTSWPVVAGARVAVHYLILFVLLPVVGLLILALLIHWI